MSGTDTERSAAAGAPEGVTPPVAPGGRTGFLSDVIVELGFASRETVEQAVRAARSPGTTVARVLVDSSAISEEQLARAIAERYGIDYINLDGFDVDPAAANLIAPGVARRYAAVPVAFVGDRLLLAMADPADAIGMNAIADMTQMKVRPAAAAQPALEALLGALPLEQPGGERPLGARAVPAEVADVPRDVPEPPTPADAELARERPARSEATPGGVAQVQAKLADVDAELDIARARVREVQEVSARLETLRHELAAEAGLHQPERVEPRPVDLREAGDRARAVELELRRIRAEATVRAGELDALRGKLGDAETELVRLRAQVDARGYELEAMRTRAESAEAEAESALRRADDAERRSEEAQHETAEARRLAEQLESSGARAEGARRALAELRAENERERETWAVAERDLLRTLDGEQSRRTQLEERLSEVERSAFAAERAFEELRLAQGRMREALRALAHPDEPELPEAN